jgi:hypothetical protein
VEGLSLADFTDDVRVIYGATLATVLNVSVSWVVITGVQDTNQDVRLQVAVLWVKSVISYPSEAPAPAPYDIESALNTSTNSTGFTAALQANLLSSTSPYTDPALVTMYQSLSVAVVSVIALSNAPTISPSAFVLSSISNSSNIVRDYTLIAVFAVLGFVIFILLCLYMWDRLTRKKAAEITGWDDNEIQADFGFFPSMRSPRKAQSPRQLGASIDSTSSPQARKSVFSFEL